MFFFVFARNRNVSKTIQLSYFCEIAARVKQYVILRFSNEMKLIEVCFSLSGRCLHLCHIVNALTSNFPPLNYRVNEAKVEKGK